MQVFSSTPVRVFEGHKSDVVDLSWSHSDFLCSASIDHTVMLWHPVRCDHGLDHHVVSTAPARVTVSTRNVLSPYLLGSLVECGGAWA